jgi:hypothetical protein
MSIAGLHGPYIKHFYAGTEDQIQAMREVYDTPSRQEVSLAEKEIPG